MGKVSLKTAVHLAAERMVGKISSINARLPLEYLKQFQPIEQDNFVKDTKFLAERANKFGSPFAVDDKSSQVDDLPFYTLGFKLLFSGIHPSHSHPRA